MAGPCDKDGRSYGARNCVAGSMTGQKTAMAVLIEPAPYILSLIEEMRAQWSGDVHAWFLHASVTQNWVSKEEVVRFGILPSAEVRAVATLWNEMRRGQPAIVFVAGWGHPLVIASIIMARLLGARVVSMSDTWTSTSGGLRSWLKRRVMNLIHAFTPGGSPQARYLRAQGVSADRIFPGRMTSDISAIRAFVSNRGSACRSASRGAIGVAETDVVFLFVGRLEHVKGPDLLLEAFANASLAKSARLVVVGDGMLRDQVASAAANDSRILFRGRLEGAALWSEFAAADVLVVPSRLEAWGLVVNEAMAAGLTVVVHDCCGCIDDLVVHGETGLVVPTGDPVAMRSALNALSSDPARVALLRRNAAKHIDCWTTEAWARNIVTAWEAALRGGGRLRHGKELT